MPDERVAMLFCRRKCSDGGFILSLGAGSNQLPLILAALKRGFRVIGVDRKLTAPGMKYCNLRIQESIIDAPAIIGHLQNSFLDGPVRGALTRSYGEAVVAASEINAFLGVAHIPPASARIFLEKGTMKNTFTQAGIPTPVVLNPAGKKTVSGQIPFPVIIKPVSGHAKDGVLQLTTPRELSQCLREKRPMLVEEFVEGPEIIAMGIVHRGHYTLLTISDKEKTGLPRFVDLKHTTPSLHANLKPAIADLGQKVASAFSLFSTPLMMEIIISGRGPLLIEAVPEFGGEYLADYLIPWSTGASLFDLAVLSITDCDPPLKKEYRPRRAVAVRYLTSPGGRIRSCRREKITGIKNLLHAELFKKTGDEVKAPTSNHDRIGVVITRGKNLNQALGAADLAYQQLEILVDAADKS